MTLLLTATIQVEATEQDTTMNQHWNSADFLLKVRRQLTHYNNETKRKIKRKGKRKKKTRKDLNSPNQRFNSIVMNGGITISSLPPSRLGAVTKSLEANDGKFIYEGIDRALESRGIRASLISSRKPYFGFSCLVNTDCGSDTGGRLVRCKKKGNDSHKGLKGIHSREHVGRRLSEITGFKHAVAAEPRNTLDGDPARHHRPCYCGSWS